MKSFTFVTSNDHKVKTARATCGEFGIDFTRRNLELTEIQASDGRVVAVDKARQAFKAIGKPVAITDDSWIIPGLNGFPGPYMKYINEWFQPEDFLRLTKDLKDRTINMQHIIVYKDAKDEKVFLVEIPAILLVEVRGSSKIRHFSIISLDGGKHSVAEAEIDGSSAFAKYPNAWHDFCEWMQSR